MTPDEQIKAAFKLLEDMVERDNLPKVYGDVSDLVQDSDALNGFIERARIILKCPRRDPPDNPRSG